MLQFYPNLTLRKHTYYARFYIPNHLYQIAHRKNFYYSLQTKDYYEAIHKIKEAAYKTDLLIQSYERKYQDMLKIRNRNTNEIKLCLTYAEVQHVFVQWWSETLKKLERYEDEIISGKKSFKDFCFYQPIKLDDIDRLVYSDYETIDGETFTETKIIQDVYDGYKTRTAEEELIANPSAFVKNTQLYNYIYKVLKKDMANNKVDRELIDIMQDNPQSIVYLFKQNDYEIIGNPGESFEKVLEKNKEDESYDVSYAIFSISDLNERMRESELLLLNMLENIKNGTPYKTPLYFQTILETAKGLNKNNLEKIEVKSPIFDYKKYLKMWEKDQKLQNHSAKSIIQHKNMLLLIIEILKNKGIDKISKKDIENLEIKLKKTPANFKQKYANQSILEVIEKYGDNKKIKKLSDPSIKCYMKQFNTFANFLLNEEIIYSNPFSRYKIKYAKGKKQSYEHFSDDEIEKIFNYKTYPECVIADNPMLHPETFWIPLLALFLGARLNELCQLDVEDVTKDSGIDCLIISPDNRDVAEKNKNHKQTKTSNRRIIPIPQKVIDLGFLKYVDNRKKNNNKKLFELTYNKNDKYTKYMGRWFAKYLDSIKIISKTKVFHSFRHNLAQNMKMLGYVNAYAYEIGGWSKNDRSAFSSYDNGQIPLKELQTAINKLEFPMIDWEKLKNRPIDAIVKTRTYHHSKCQK